jgi:hypothetical protein
VLVAAVLRPEQREDGQLEVVRRSLEQLADTVELPVRETESLVEGLVGDRAQIDRVSRASGGDALRSDEKSDTFHLADSPP